MPANIKQFISWGHKMNTSTHCYIHYGFVKAFNHIGYQTRWLYEDDDISKIDLSNSLFLVEGSQSNNIPIRDDCYYIVHNCDMSKFEKIDPKKLLIIQVFTTDVIDRNTPKINDFYYIDKKEWTTLYLFWATDLLPYEIDENIRSIDDNFIENMTVLVGTMQWEWYEPWNIVEKTCKKNDIAFKHYHPGTVDMKGNMDLIKKCIIAPAVQFKWQTEKGYIPCRIFKNISYGKMGMTNNVHVRNLFENPILYSSNIEELIEMGLEYEKQDAQVKKSKLIPLMEEVKKNHTYLNRIDYCMKYFDGHFDGIV